MKYFVSYHHSGLAYGWGFGRCCIERMNPITEIEDIVKMEDAIRRINPKLEHSEVAITYWRIFEEAE